MKLSEVLAHLQAINLKLDGKNDYKNVAEAAKEHGAKLTNAQVWKLIDKLGEDLAEVEDDL